MPRTPSQAISAGYTKAAPTISDYVAIADAADSNELKFSLLPQVLRAQVQTESGTTRTLAQSDDGTIIRLTGASNQTITVPSLAAGTQVLVRVVGAGVPSLAASGVTINDDLDVEGGLEQGSTFALVWASTTVVDVI